MAQSLTSEQKIDLEAISGGTISEALGGAAAVVLTILGLLNVEPVYMLSIAAIAVGAGLMFQGSTIAAEYSEMIRQLGGEKIRGVNLGGGLGIEISTGGAGIALGVLSLLGVAPAALLPISSIVLGCGVAFSSTTISRLNDLKIMHSGADQKVRRMAGGAVDAASGAQILFGLGAATLGILTLVGVSPMVTLTMIGLLALGFSILVSGLSISGRAFTALKY